MTMSDTSTAATVGAPVDTAAHGDGVPASAAHGADEHGEHGEAPLGPIDWPAWGLSLVGILLGGVVAVCLYLTAYPS